MQCHNRYVNLEDKKKYTDLITIRQASQIIQKHLGEKPTGPNGWDPRIDQALRKRRIIGYIYRRRLYVRESDVQTWLRETIAYPNVRKGKSGTKWKRNAWEYKVKAPSVQPTISLEKKVFDRIEQEQKEKNIDNRSYVINEILKAHYGIE